MSIPRSIEVLGAWTTKRWDHVDARLFAERDDGVEVEFDADGDFTISYLSEGTDGIAVPGRVMARLIADARARTAQTLEAAHDTEA